MTKGIIIRRVMAMGIIVTGFAPALSACGNRKPTPVEEAPFFLDCGSKDQILGFMNPIDARSPVELLVDSRFTDIEKSQIESAIHTWNQWNRVHLLKRELFKIRYSDLTVASLPQHNRDCGFPGASHQLSIVKETSMEHWRSIGLNEFNPGVTIRCQRGQEFVARQLIILNLSVGVKVDQIHTVVLHELGHSLGLKHSCDPNSTSEQYVNCQKIQADQNHEYHEAVMYPIIEAGILKSEPTRNDQSRAACILEFSR